MTQILYSKILLNKVIDMGYFVTGKILVVYVNSHAHATIAYNIYVDPSSPLEGERRSVKRFYEC